MAGYGWRWIDAKLERVVTACAPAVRVVVVACPWPPEEDGERLKPHLEAAASLALGRVTDRIVRRVAP